MGAPGRTQVALRLAAVLLAALAAPASGNPDEPAALRAILAGQRPPSGVVFEIVSGDPQTLRWAIPRVTDYAGRLRARFPALPIAVVTHGKEQFALTREKQREFAGVHDPVEQLVRDQDIPVHVCETYANRHRVYTEDFPDYVAVAAAGPVQIRNYQENGYLLVTLHRPAATPGSTAPRSEDTDRERRPGRERAPAD